MLQESKVYRIRAVWIMKEDWALGFAVRKLQEYRQKQLQQS